MAECVEEPSAVIVEPKFVRATVAQPTIVEPSRTPPPSSGRSVAADIRRKKVVAVELKSFRGS